ncbi:MAG TPA: cysteine peptidase family C39 domain-containing protein [Methanotrichaceae archaeon]|nr:cysteine peptidase family C39 domain-containing protein [Methanotrichaceae archaeon]
MKKFRLLKATRQSTEYSCGASALQAVLSYWGKDLDEEELMKLLHTTPETGTYPEDLVKVAHELGFEAEVKENLTIDDVEKSTKKGNPVIVLGQAWRSQEDSKKAVTDDWEDGHYVVILAVDKEYVYFEDPFVRMGKGFLPRQTFEDQWHNIGGKTPTDASKQMHLGIFIRGKKPAKPQSLKQLDSSKLDFSKIAPLHLIVIEFKGEILPYDIMEVARSTWETGLIRPAAFLFLRKDKEGKLSAVEGGNLQEEEEVIEIDALLAVMAGLRLGSQESAKVRAISAEKAASGGDFGLSVKDIMRIGERLPKDSSVMILLLEHLWAKKFRDVISSYGGVLVNQEIIKADTLAKLGAKLAESP